MASDMDNSHVVVTFITSRYVKKIVNEKLMDNCFLEFVYAVVMESETRDIILWEGQVGLYLGDCRFVDIMSDDSNLDRSVDELIMCAIDY
jgi:hypothetical protein